METHDYFDDIDWAAMDTPPVFHTVIYEATQRPGKEAAETVVITMAEDFAALAAAWPTATSEFRSAAFFSVGRLHYAEVGLMRIPQELGRSEILAVPGVVGPSEDEPTVLAKKIANITREVVRRHEEHEQSQRPREAAPPKQPDDGETYLKLLAIRACKPYSGPGPEAVSVVILRQGHVWSAKEGLLYVAQTAT